MGSDPIERCTFEARSSSQFVQFVSKRLAKLIDHRRRVRDQLGIQSGQWTVISLMTEQLELCRVSRRPAQPHRLDS